jgi:peptidoglycan/xylan/chitin deacetylase (PgdA/CDA1 family)
LVARLFSVLLIFFAGRAPAFAEAAEIAITVDDLPSHSNLPPGVTWAEVAQRFIAALTASGIPSVYGFVNGYRLKILPGTEDVLKLWVEAGFLLGNHTYAHSDLNTTTAQLFEKDIADDEPVLESFMGSRDWHWFRYPFGHEGDTVEKRRAVKAYLKEHGYRIAQVTLDFHDYEWNEPYVRCAKLGNTEAIAWLKASYLATAMEYIAMGQQIASALYGRDVKHLLLLHFSPFDSLMLPELLDRLMRQNVRFVSLQEADADPAYQRDPETTFPEHGNILDRWLQVGHVRYPPHADIPVAKLGSMCQ